MKQALFIIENLNQSGSPLTALHFIKTISIKYNVTLVVLCGNNKDDLARKDDFDDYCNKIIILKFHSLLSKSFKANFLYYISNIKKKLKRILNSNHFDIVYLNRYYICGYLAKFIKRKYKINLIFNSLGQISLSSKFLHLKVLYKISIYLICKYCDYFIAISEQCFPKNIHKYTIKRMIIHDYPEITKKTANKIFSKKNRIVLGQIGYYCPLKNQLFSLILVKLLLEKGFDIQIRFIGFIMDDEYWEKINFFIDNNKLNNCVKFYNSDYNKEVFFDEIDIALLPSLSEGLSLTILESYYRKTNIIVSYATPIEANYGNITRIDLKCAKDWIEYISSESYKTNFEIDFDLMDEFKKRLLAIL